MCGLYNPTNVSHAVRLWESKTDIFYGLAIWQAFGIAFVVESLA
jgi:hypothetical protein